MRAAGTSWGRYPQAKAARLLPLHHRNSPLPGFRGVGLPYGNGRSYGDSCLNPGGTLLQTRGLDRFIAFDADSGVVECEAGVLLSEIIDLALPKGWFPAVTPGTRFVTVGGAIANDVHGKNHPAAGSFGAHLLDFELLRSDGQRLYCSTKENADWFRATIGGLGLTGVIVSVRLQLRHVPGTSIGTETRRFARLADFFALSRDTSDSEYSVAWVDCLAKGASLGRGVFMHGNHTASDTGRAAGRKLRVPFTPPVSLVNAVSLRAFNTLYFHNAPQQPQRQAMNHDAFFYPLDGVADWNRMYGPRGFLQYQCVVPPTHAEAATSELLERIAASGQGSFLVVLKNLGNHPPAGLLSFPRAGTTLALDFPFRGPATLELLSRLDETVMAAGGAVYPAKDARMSPAMFTASFPELPTFRQYVDPRLSSGFWRRVAEPTTTEQRR